nr:BTB and MATH domain-containing protein 36-like isoform X2 [Hydra vulgaris]XP_047136174.1 BTB and MATH domain-containing protein 36 isoform X2 [Hydra vulgaris]
MDKSFWEFNKKFDITFLVEGEELYVHRYVLSSSSPVFKVLLESDNFVEKNKRVISLPNKNKENIQEMLNYIYPFGHQISDKTNIDCLLILSREYQINKIHNLCEEFLLKKVPTFELLITAQEFQLKNLESKCIEYFSEKALISLENHPKYNELSEDNKLQLAERQNMTLQAACDKASSKNNWFIDTNVLSEP